MSSQSSIRVVVTAGSVRGLLPVRAAIIVAVLSPMRIRVGVGVGSTLGVTFAGRAAILASVGAAVDR